MHPVICTIGSFTVYSYGLMLALAFIASLTLVSRAAKRRGLDVDAIVNLVFLVFVAGIAGARVFYVIENWRYYLTDPVEIVFLQHGGLSWFGGLFAGTLSAALYLKKKKLCVPLVLDVLAPYIALGQAIGRIGCFLNGCCYGKGSGHGLYSPAQDAVLIPVQLYASLALLAIFGILRFAEERPHAAGTVFYLYTLLYSAKRFFIEFLRADNAVLVSGLTLFQCISILIFAASLIGLIRARRPTHSP